jgi:hypothetical protein
MVGEQRLLLERALSAERSHRDELRIGLLQSVEATEREMQTKFQHTRDAQQDMQTKMMTLDEQMRIAIGQALEDHRGQLTAWNSEELEALRREVHRLLEDHTGKHNAALHSSIGAAYQGASLDRHEMKRHLQEFLRQDAEVQQCLQHSLEPWQQDLDLRIAELAARPTSSDTIQVQVLCERFGQLEDQLRSSGHVSKAELQDEVTRLWTALDCHTHDFKMKLNQSEGRVASPAGSPVGDQRLPSPTLSGSRSPSMMLIPIAPLTSTRASMVVASPSSTLAFPSLRAASPPAVSRPRDTADPARSPAAGVSAPKARRSVAIA